MHWFRLGISALSISCGANFGWAADRPVVVELFTSQGCSSCPPAEAFIVDLARNRHDVLALAFHVDYWDRLGWKDLFSSAFATQRQSGYAASVRGSQVYTPQVVVDGKTEAIGSDEDAVNGLIAEAALHGTDVPMALARDPHGVVINVGSGSGTASIILIGFDPQRQTSIRRGENAGRSILQANIVRSLEMVGEWDGKPTSVVRPVPFGDSTAVLLQNADGQILGAAQLHK